MRKFVFLFFVFTFVLGSISPAAFAADCAKDTLIDRFGDWFGNLGKKEKTKQKRIAARKANRLADCVEKQGRGTAGAV